MLVDANILLYSVDESSQFHGAAAAWLTDALNGTRRVALPWISLTAFLRIATNPRASSNPLSLSDAWEILDGWLAAPTSWIPQPGPGHHEILRRLTIDRDLRAGLVTDAVLAALCIEHGLDIVSADSDFALIRRPHLDQPGRSLNETGQTMRLAPSPQYRSRRTRLYSLPVGSRGSSSSKSIERGHLLARQVLTAERAATSRRSPRSVRRRASAGRRP